MRHMYVFSVYVVDKYASVWPGRRKPNMTAMGSNELGDWNEWPDDVVVLQSE